MSDGREALHGSAEQTAECLGLRLAELGILGGYMRHRAVMLTELVAPAGTRPAARRGRVAVCRQRGGQRLDPLRRRGALDNRLVPALQLGDLPPGKGGYCGWPGRLG